MDKCTCTMNQKTTGDGCKYCNPQYYISILEDQLKENTRASDEVIRGLVDALERQARCSDFLLKGKTVRDYDETCGETEKALAQARKHLGE